MLSLVGVPLGNIEDISIRQLKALLSSDCILAEDTRNFLKIRSVLKDKLPEILKTLNLTTENRPQLISYREQNHERVIKEIIELLRQEKSIIYISDAGMPSISDPGYKLVSEIVELGYEIDVIPGATAVDTALVISGLPTDRFTFLGFLPRTPSKFIKQINIFIDTESTLIFYESPFRLIKALELIDKNYPEANVVICNDLTKKFQKVVRGKAKEILDEIKDKAIKGEWVVLLRK